MGDITLILQRVGEGDERAKAALFDLAYDELKRLARAKLRGKVGIDVSPSTLVHEVYLKYAPHEGRFGSSYHFFCVMAQAMRQVIVDTARRHTAQKRGGGRYASDAVDLVADKGVDIESLIQLESVVRHLEAEDPELAEVVTLRFFGGLDFDAIAQILGVSERTARRRWTIARGFIGTALGQQLEEPSASS